jgi:soluble lytic murein transglycosylase-like protein
MSVNNVYQNIENILRRIEEIKVRFSPKRSDNVFKEILQEEIEAAGNNQIEPDGKQVKAENKTGSYDAIIEAAAEQFKIPSALIKAVIKQESNFDPSAVSSKGAMGLMQLMPQTAELLNVGDPFNPDENIFAGTRYLVNMINRYNGNINRALAAYNAGPQKVKDEIPKIPETQNYVDSVLHYYESFSKYIDEEF